MQDVLSVHNTQISFFMTFADLRIENYLLLVKEDELLIKF